MKKSNKNQRKNMFTKDKVALSSAEYDIPNEKKILLNKTDKTHVITYDLGHIYGSW